MSAQGVPDEAILLGDFNFQPDSAEYDLLAGPRSDYGGRITNPRGLVDAWRAAGHDGSGAPGDVRGQPARLDYAFVSNALAARVTGCRVDDAATGSDHLPLWSDMDL